MEIANEHTLLMSCALCCAVCCGPLLPPLPHIYRICIYISVCVCSACVFMCCAFVWVSTEFVDWLTWVGWLVVNTMTRRVQHKRKDEEKNAHRISLYSLSSLVAVRTFHFITDDVMRKMCVCLCVSVYEMNNAPHNVWSLHWNWEKRKWKRRSCREMRDARRNEKLK